MNLPNPENDGKFPEAAGYFDFSMTGKLLLSGQKRADLLQGITTNDIDKLLPGQSIDAFFLDKFGKIQTSTKILAFKQHFILLLPFLQTEKIAERLEKDARLLKCNIENITFDYALLNIMGDNAKEQLTKMLGKIESNSFTLHSLHSIVFQHKGGVDKAKEQATLEDFQVQTSTPFPSFNSINSGVDFTIIKSNRAKLQNFDLLIPKDGLEKVMTKLKQNKIIKQDTQSFENQRIKSGYPQFGTDYDEANNPIELGPAANRFLSENKGCYVGQEIITKLRHKANEKTAIKLVKLTSNNQKKPFKKGTLVYHRQKESERIRYTEVGTITSSSVDKESKKAYSLAYFKKPFYDTLKGRDLFTGKSKIVTKTTFF